jgi:hypothetical protein
VIGRLSPEILARTHYKFFSLICVPTIHLFHIFHTFLFVMAGAQIVLSGSSTIYISLGGGGGGGGGGEQGTSSIKQTSSGLIRQYRALVKQLFEGVVQQINGRLDAVAIIDIMKRIIETDSSLQKSIKECKCNTRFFFVCKSLFMFSWVVFSFLLVACHCD